MGFGKFPNTQYFILVTNSNLITPLGSFQANENIELTNMQFTLQKVGAHVGTERFRIHLFGNADHVTAIASSGWVTVDDIDTLTASSWTGYITFDFDQFPINKNSVYYVAAEMDGYAYPGDDTYYWGFALDWPEEMSINNELNIRGAMLNIIGY